MNENVPLLIAEAMAAWNEVYQGYPDHYVKVSGCLTLASELCGGRLSEQLAEEASKFNQSVLTKTMYRPGFEQLAADAINETAGEIIVKVEMNTQLCYDCATKHLADAAVAWSEMKSGETAALLDVLGNLSHASNHLIEKHPDLANAIRTDRKAIWESLIQQTPFIRPDFESRVGDVFAAAKHEELLKISREEQGREVMRCIAEAKRRRHV